ncbi:DUF3626 domain-containing protein [Phycicoccus sp. Soil748]|uniref:DUF3626 domain-containing protein n=1 Tax=Phycicoccus sp. Soil748 TaxID=1736397 RepID=UPI000AF9AEE4|nr:DUF3626 domain-containing protein [Phycicoccus sp. Soil748]
MTDLSTWAAAAVTHVQRAARGTAVDPSLRVTLNFHPDRLHQGVPILRALATAGAYRSQFETGTSNGGLTAHPGGDRWRWEQRIFGGAYDRAPADQRPKYGALNHRLRSVGGAPRFGSAHLRLAPHTLERTTFCYPDSVFEPEHLGTATALDLTRRADDDLAAGTVEELDSYVEAHVHGVVDLALDVEALVLDPVYRGSDVERAARDLPCALEWHEGFVVDLDTVRRHPGYRGPEVVALAEKVAVEGVLDPAVIGAAALSGAHDPQRLKKVWHHLARWGAPDLRAAR